MLTMASRLLTWSGQHAYFAASFEDDHLGKHNLDFYLIDPEHKILYQYNDTNSIYGPDKMDKGETTK
jgi:hypothetical protein